MVRWRKSRRKRGEEEEVADLHTNTVHILLLTLTAPLSSSCSSHKLHKIISFLLDSGRFMAQTPDGSFIFPLFLSFYFSFSPV